MTYEFLKAQGATERRKWESFTCWVDKICTPQDDPERRRLCVLRIEEYFRNSRGMICLMRGNYFTRLKCDSFVRFSMFPAAGRSVPQAPSIPEGNGPKKQDGCPKPHFLGGRGLPEGGRAAVGCPG